MGFVFAVCAASFVCGPVSVGAQSRDLFAGGMSIPDEVGSLPSRARKSAAPKVVVPLKLEALRSETHPALRTAVVLEGEVVRLVGEGFGDDAAGRSIEAHIGGQRILLKVLSWKDDEIRVEVPSYALLGVDAKRASELRAELLRTKKRVVGPTLQLGIALSGNWIASRSVQVAVEWRDLDADGSLSDEDCDDFDPRRRPGLTEVYDAEGIDEDCNPNTQATEPPAPVAQPAAETESEPAPADGLDGELLDEL
jgi:hypothetical protein